MYRWRASSTDREKAVSEPVAIGCEVSLLVVADAVGSGIICANDSAPGPSAVAGYPHAERRLTSLNLIVSAGGGRDAH